jgi:hypothetical protein
LYSKRRLNSLRGFVEVLTDFGAACEGKTAKPGKRINGKAGVLNPYVTTFACETLNERLIR